MNARTARLSRLRFRRPFAMLSSLGCAVVLCGCATPPPPTTNESLPVNLQARPGEVLQEVMTTRGDATYVCRREPSAVTGFDAAPARSAAADSAPLQWKDEGTEATLIDAAGKSVGTIAPGNHFIAYDGSYVIGTPRARNQVDATALAWVRYTARFVAAPRPGEGRFANVSSIQRVDTKGGLPPQPECTQEGAYAYVPFEARYMIYQEQSQADPQRVVP